MNTPQKSRRTAAWKRAKYQSDPEWAERERARNRKRSRPGPKRARRLAQIAIQKGQLVRPSRCEGQNCRSGRGVIQAAHSDYTKPLEVRWLCRSCHSLWDREEPKERGDSADRADAEALRIQAEKKAREWGREGMIDAIRRWNVLYGEPPTAIGWNPGQARYLGRPDLIERFKRGRWPHSSSVRKTFGSWANGIEAAGFPRPTVGRRTQRIKDIDPPNPSGYCWCGCGGKTARAKHTRRGTVAGEHLRYLRGHGRKTVADKARCSRR